MREILFRAKSINRNKGYHRTKYKNGDWVYGLLTKLYDEQFKNLPAEMTNEYGVSGIEIDHNTIGQYTGLTDKNGKKIFEGDIVKEEYEVFVSARAKEKRVKIGYVEYESNSLCCGYYAYFWNDKEKWRGNFAIHCGCEVIGNIHDNPELLKGGEG